MMSLGSQSLHLFENVYVSFNHTHKYICFGTQNGFHIYNTEPFKKIISCMIEGGVSIVKMYYESNIVLFVGRQTNGPYPNNKLIIWDDDKQRVIGDISYRTPIRAVDISKYHIFLATDTNLYVHGFEKLNIVKTVPLSSADPLQIDTGHDIPNTLLGVSFASGQDSNPMFAFRGDARGTVCLGRVLSPTILTIIAHQSAIRHFVLSEDGSYLATCSEKGTVIRFFRTDTGCQINEFRRGSDPVSVQCLALNHDGSLLAVSSDKGTLHLFNTEVNDACPVQNSQFHRMGMSYLRPFLPHYFNNKWSGVNLQIPNIRTVSMFHIKQSLLYTIGDDGQFYVLDYTNPQQIRIEKCIKYYADDSDPFSERSSTIQ